MLLISVMQMEILSVLYGVGDWWLNTCLGPAREGGLRKLTLLSPDRMGRNEERIKWTVRVQERDFCKVLLIGALGRKCHSSFMLPDVILFIVSQATYISGQNWIYVQDIDIDNRHFTSKLLNIHFISGWINASIDQWVITNVIWSAFRAEIYLYF